MQKPFIIVDGSSFLFRAYHALPQLTNRLGEPTGAIYGVANMMKRLLQTHDPEHIVIVFDHPGRTFRDDLLSTYKANRSMMPEELAAQIQPLKNLLQVMGFPLLEIPGVEADDVIGSLAMQVNAKIPICIVTGDKDFAQLVNEHIYLLNTMNDSVLDKKGIEEKYGIMPEQFIDYLTLVGDSVDNIPGVPSVGPKTAVKWLQQYSHLENIIANAADISGKVGEKLRAFIPNIPLTKQLVTIKCDVDVPQWQSFSLKKIDLNELAILVKHFDFRRWSEELIAAQATTEPALDYETITTIEQWQVWLQLLRNSDYFSLDTETDSLDYLSANIVGLSFAISSEKAAYLPLSHHSDKTQLLWKDIVDDLQILLNKSPQKIIFQHGKYDQHVLANVNICLPEMKADTLLMAHVLNSTGRHDLKTLAQQYLNRDTKSYSELTGKGKKQITFSEVDIGAATQYAGDDAAITLALYEHLNPLLIKDEVSKIFFEIEMPLIPVLYAMERRGVLIDSDLLTTQSIAIGNTLDELEEKAHGVVGRTFNLQSPKQLQEILFEELKLPILEKTPTGQASTSEEVLQQLALDYELPNIILSHRHLSKLKSTYLDALPKQVNVKTGRVHTSYHQAGTNTGRLSSSDPNLQNIPIRSEEGRRIRQAFIAPRGYCIVAADYSQIELRIMAHLSNDATLLSAFHQNQDIHRATAAEVFGVPLDAVSADQRRSAKAINFGLLYGMSSFGLAKQLGIGRKEAQEYVELYFSRYPGVKTYMDSTKVFAHEQGYVKTLFGRRLYLTEINSKNISRQKGAERAAINAPMQGTAADIIKRAMIAMHHAMAASTLSAHMIMQVHDELVFEVKESDVKAFCDVIRTHMENAAQLHVPLVVDIGTGTNWDEAH